MLCDKKRIKGTTITSLKVVFDALVPIAKANENPWHWLAARLFFEAYAIALDDRHEAVRHYI